MPILGGLFSKKEKNGTASSSTASVSPTSPSKIRKSRPPRKSVADDNTSYFSSTASAVVDDHDDDYVLPPSNSPSRLNGRHPYSKPGVVPPSTDSFGSSSGLQNLFRRRESGELLSPLRSNGSSQFLAPPLTPSSSSLHPPPTRASVFGGYEYKDDAGNSVSSSIVTSSAPELRTPLTQQQQVNAKQASGGMFSWVRDRKKSSGKKDIKESRPSFSSSKSEAALKASRYDQTPPPPMPPPKATREIPRERGFVPPVRPNARAKLSASDKQDDDQFDLKDYRGIRAPSPGPNNPLRSGMRLFPVFALPRTMPLCHALFKYSVTCFCFFPFSRAL